MALQDKLHHQRLLVTYEEQRSVIRRQTQALREEIVRLTDILQELQTKLLYLEPRANAAQAIQSAASTVPSFETDKIARGFARIEEKVGRLEAGAIVYRQRDTGTNNVLRINDQQEEVRAELERLKQAKGK